MLLLCKKVFFILVWVIILNGSTINAMFEKIGDYPCAKPYIDFLPLSPGAVPQAVVVPYRYAPPTTNHIVNVPEGSSTVIEDNETSVVMGPVSPCIEALITNKDIYAQKLLAVHLYHTNKYVSLTNKISTVFNQSSPSDLQVILHSVHMEDNLYTKRKYGPGPHLFSWKDAHNGRSQQRVMLDLANTIASNLHIPRANIQTNLYHPVTPLNRLGQYQSANFCTITDMASFTPHSIDIYKENIANLVSNNIITANNIEWNYEGPNKDMFTFVSEHLNARNYLSIQDNYLTRVQEIVCLNCGRCEKCTQTTQSIN